MRADKFFSERFGSRTKSAEALKRGLVLRDGKPLSPDDEVSEGEAFSFLSELKYVSGGGYKLERGLDRFSLSVEGMTFADLGASTGGFTDCLLQRGAEKVYCVDVGKSQLFPALASDKRVVVMDGTNARYLDRESFPEPIDGVVSDLSFISLRLVLPAIAQILSDGGKALVLFKPQFECGGKGLGKSGVLPARYHEGLLADFYDFSKTLDLAPIALVNAPIRPRKNIEYVLYLLKGGIAADRSDFLHSLYHII